MALSWQDRFRCSRRLYGNRNILAVWALVTCLENPLPARNKNLPVSVIATAEAIFCLSLPRLATPCVNSCAFHQLIQNMLHIAMKNISLMQKMSLLQSAPREKLWLIFLPRHKKPEAVVFQFPLTVRNLRITCPLTECNVGGLGKLRDEGI